MRVPLLPIFSLLSPRTISYLPSLSMSVKRKAAADSVDGSAKKSRAITSFFASNGSSSSSTPTVNFNKAKWVNSLTPDQKQLLQLEIDTLHESWLAVLKDELVTTSFLNLKKFLQEERKKGKVIYPPDRDIYSWSRYTPLNTVKVVIIGQDPYHGPRQAHGLCFSVVPPTTAPPSLKNIYIALKNDFPGFQPPPRNGGLLTPWAENGVLMLNTCLTVREKDPNSHKDKGWEKLTQRVIDTVAQKRIRGVVFMAWGKPAGTRVTRIDKQKHLVLTSVHPSPFSARNGFLDCGHFKRANEWLQERYGAEGPVNWNLNKSPMSTKSAKPVKEGIPSAGDLKDAKTTAKPKTYADDMDMDDEEEALMAAMADEAEKLQSSQPNVEDSKSEVASEKDTPDREIKDSDNSEVDVGANSANVDDKGASESSTRVELEAATSEEEEKEKNEDEPMKNGSGSAPVSAEEIVREAEVEKDKEASSEKNSKDNENED